MFQPFQRLGDSRPGGVGLGLAVAHGFLTAMGATIEIDDTPGGGTTVLIGLPVDMSRVLVVDDEQPILRAMAVNLRARGYDVDVAATGEEALDLAVAAPSRRRRRSTSGFPGSAAST